MENFAGIENEFAEYDNAEIVVIPVPYDGTVTWGRGANQGPAAILEAADNMELYDIETNSEVYKKGIYLASPVEENKTPEDMVKAVDMACSEYIGDEKFVVLLGGEHSISIGSIRAFRRAFPKLTVLQIDAHSDLRASYDGTPFSHACAMHEASKHVNLIQVGIRSMDRSELEYMKKDRVFFAHDIRKNPSWIDDVVKVISTDDVYITIDVDGLDPSIMPATGTPEPGGLFWDETLELLKRVFSAKRVVGLDLVELAPQDGQHASDFLVAKLLYKMLSYKFNL